MERLRLFYLRHIRIIPGVKSYVLATIFIFVFGISLTFVAWYADRNRLDQQRQTELNQQANDIENAVIARLNIYEQILRGASGLVSASDMVKPDEWNRFIGQYDLTSAYPGISGVGYIASVKGEDASAYTEQMRALGYSDFTIKPEGARAEYAPISYVHSISSNNSAAIGFDVLTEPSRKQSIDTARDSGEVNVSEKLLLLSDAQQNVNSPGFIMYTATYRTNTIPKTVEERRAALRGYVFAGFRADYFFNKVLDGMAEDSMGGLAVYDGATTDTNSILYKTPRFDETSNTDINRTFTTEIFNRPWTLQFAGAHTSTPQDNQRSIAIAVGGTLLSAAVAGFLFLVMFSRARDIVYVKQKEAQQAKDDLLSLASHQLRTPATAVKQYLGMVLEGYTGKVSSKQEPALQKAYASNERQLEIINQILYVAKADAGRLSITRSRFDLNILINDIVLDLEDTIEEREQSIKIETSRKKLIIHADEASMRMVIENLISNASKYSHPNSVITVKTDTEDGKAVVSVIDQGVGIEPVDQEKLFKKFSRIENELSLQVGGSGIGLYIDKVLVELHGGTIKVDSKIGEGSTFTVRIPKKLANNLTDDNNGNSP